MRTIEGWTKEEQKELEDLYVFSSPMSAISIIVNDCGYCLHDKWYRADHNDELKMAQDIIDFFNHEAGFLERKYYVKILNRFYLNNNHEYEHYTFADSNETGTYQTQFTMQEIKDIDERLVPFAVEVTDD